MNRTNRVVSGMWLFSFIACFAWNVACDVVVAEEPNVIVVMTDDQGYPELSVHGNPVLQTPHLDSLHDESLRLTDYHVAPMCTPTRGQLLTGIDAARNGAINVSSGRAFTASGNPYDRQLLWRRGVCHGSIW